jgi:hypothetical protein
MGHTPKKPTKVEINLREPDDVAPAAPHVPVVAADDLVIPKRWHDVLDQVLAVGTADAGDGCMASRCDPPKEAGLVHLPKSQMVYVNMGNPRPAERWVPAWHLQNAAVNGFHYLSARRLYVEPSVPIYASLEHLFGRGEAWTGGSATDAEMHDARKIGKVERVEIEAMVEISNVGIGSASQTQLIKFRGTWLPLRRLSLSPGRPSERRQVNYPNIKVL